MTFPSRRVIVEYERPAPSNGSASHFAAMAKGMNDAQVVRLGGSVPAFAVKQNSDMTRHNFGVIIFNVAGSEIRVMGHDDEATLEASALSILNRRYSVHEVEQAFAAQGVQLRNVTPKGFRGLFAFLDGRPSHAVYAYVIQGGCKCALQPAIRHATTSRHGNVEILWLRGEKSATHDALQELR